MNHICLTGVGVTVINGIIAWQLKRYSEVYGLEIPIGVASVLGYLIVRRVQHVEWVAAFYMMVVASCISFYLLAVAQSSYYTVYVWYPLLFFGTILLCGRWVGLISVSVIFVESLAVLVANGQHGFVLAQGLDFAVTCLVTRSTMVSVLLAALAIAGSVEVSRRRADQAHRKANALNLQKASLSLLGDMGRDISRNMQSPLNALQKKLDEVLQWNPEDTLHNRGPQLLSSLQQSAQELGRLTESLLIFSQTRGEQDNVSMRAVEFLQHLNELTREKAIARGVSLDFSADQPQARIQIPAASALFALVSLVNKGIEAAAGQEPAWVRLQLRVYGTQMQIRVLDSGPSLSHQERRTILEQTSQRRAWDVNLRLSLDFLDSIGGHMTLDSYSPDTCYVLSIPFSRAPDQKSHAA